MKPLKLEHISDRPLSHQDLNEAYGDKCMFFMDKKDAVLHLEWYQKEFPHRAVYIYPIKNCHEKDMMVVKSEPIEPGKNKLHKNVINFKSWYKPKPDSLYLEGWLVSTPYGCD
jgi:hypothetical protein